MTQNLVVRLVQNKQELEEIFKLRYQIYCAAPEKERPSDFKPEDFPDGLEKDFWDDYSVHFIALQDGEVVGTLRLIKGAECPVGFLMEDTFVLPPGLSKNAGLEASRMAVAPRARKKGIRNELDQKAMQWSVDNGYAWWCLAIQDYLLVSCYQAGWDIEKISGATPYHGTTVYAIIVFLEKTFENFSHEKTS